MDHIADGADLLARAPMLCHRGITPQIGSRPGGQGRDALPST
jgi:hypothetical protein